MDYQLRTPVGFLVFNRPDKTARVLRAIAAARPPVLMVVADGPRPGNEQDQARCREVRQLIDTVNWECEVRVNYSDVHLGMGRREATGMDWFFEQSEQVIILEDDTLPHPHFFRYAEELLERYRDDERVFMISGDNHHPNHQRSTYSYSFSRQPLTWGWASWRRAWRYYDFEMRLWPELRAGNWLWDVLQDRQSVKYWTRLFDDTHAGLIDTWDYQWVLACWAQGGLTAVPRTNLISNIGFGAAATNTTSASHPLAEVASEPLVFPLSHPPFVVRDSIADSIDALMLFSPGMSGRIKRIAHGFRTIKSGR